MAIESTPAHDDGLVHTIRAGCTAICCRLAVARPVVHAAQPVQRRNMNAKYGTSGVAAGKIARVDRQVYRTGVTLRRCSR